MFSLEVAPSSCACTHPWASPQTRAGCTVGVPGLAAELPKHCGLCSVLASYKFFPLHRVCMNIGFISPGWEPRSGAVDSQWGPLLSHQQGMRTHFPKSSSEFDTHLSCLAIHTGCYVLFLLDSFVKPEFLIYYLSLEGSNDLMFGTARVLCVARRLYHWALLLLTGC